MAKQFKHKSDPSIKVSRIKGQLRLMEELGKISKETKNLLEKELMLDYIVEEWNKPPLWKQMFRDALALMEEYDIKLYTQNAMVPMTILWDDYNYRVHLQNFPIIFDAEYIKQLPKIYKQHKVIDRKVERNGKNITAIELLKDLFHSAGLRFPGAERRGSIEIEDAIEREYLKAKELGDCEGAKDHLQLARWLEELVELRERLRARQTFLKGEVALYNRMKDFQDILIDQYPEKCCTYDNLLDVLEAHNYQREKEIQVPESNIIHFLNSKGWIIKN